MASVPVYCLCRLPYDVETIDGRRLLENAHVLSLKDNDQSANLEALIDAGASTFKIEGRLKDLAYVKNATGRYRKLLDNVQMKKVFEKAGETMWVCRNCGHIVIGPKAPEVCPCCDHPQSYFEVCAQNY